MIENDIYNDPFSHDQYLYFGNLSKLLKRFSFDEKMRICNVYSRKAIQFENTKKYDKIKDYPLPWCLETFALLSIESYEYSDNNFIGNNKKKFTKMINAIWHFIPKAFQTQYVNDNTIDYILPVTALTQFYLQESFWVKFFRYWHFF